MTFPRTVPDRCRSWTEKSSTTLSSACSSWEGATMFHSVCVAQCGENRDWALLRGLHYHTCPVKMQLRQLVIM